MHIRRINSADEFARLAPDWNRLAGDVPFRRWEWLHAWWRHYGQGKELYLLAAEERGEIVGLAPWCLEASATRGRVLKMLGSGEACTDYLSLLARTTCEEAVASAVANWLTAADASAARGENSWDLLELAGIEQSDGVVAQLVAQLAEEGCAVHRRPEPNCWRIELPASWDDYVAELSRSHRRQVRRCERRLETPDFARLHTASNESSLQQGWEILVNLHQRRRNSLGEPGCFASPAFSGFLREAAENLLAAGCLELHWLELSGRPAVAELLFVESGIVYAYQAGVEPDLTDEEPGRLMNVVLLKRAIADSRRAFDFLRGDEPYKAHWRAQPRACVELRIAPPRAAAQLRHGAWLAGESVKQWIKSGLSLVGMH